ncbi:MAG: hypothetical protein ACRECH_13400, partial [Nitrososphaerales archaeon]
VAKLLDFVDSIAPLSDRISPPEAPIDTNFGRVYGLLETKFKFAKFSSSDVLNAYQNEFHLISSLSIISTYLARLANRGVLTRSKSGTGWEYRISKTQQLTHVTPSAISSPPDNLIPP